MHSTLTIQPSTQQCATSSTRYGHHSLEIAAACATKPTYRPSQCTVTVCSGKSAGVSTNTHRRNIMPTGRPLGLATIKQHLSAVAHDLPAGTDREMVTTIATHLGQKNFMRPDVLHDVVKDLDAFVGRQREFLGGDTVAYTNRCIDALARMEAKFADAMRPTKKAPTKKMMGTYAPKEAKPTVSAGVSRHRGDRWCLQGAARRGVRQHLRPGHLRLAASPGQRHGALDLLSVAQLSR
jgi:hypothetical protein